MAPAALGDRAIVVAGFMGAGKTTVGRALARRLRRPFVDLDREIERLASARIADLFAREGEPELPAPGGGGRGERARLAAIGP